MSEWERPVQYEFLAVNNGNEYRVGKDGVSEIRKFDSSERYEVRKDSVHPFRIGVPEKMVTNVLRVVGGPEREKVDG